MLPRLVSDPKLRQRFEQEARVASRIESDHVVQVVAAGVEEETGAPWIAMELLRGEPLGRYVEQRGMLPRERVWEIFSQLTHAVGGAHAVGIVHRDLKPDNVFVTTGRSASGHVEACEQHARLPRR